MKDNIKIFIIGLLIGSIITTGAFYIYSKATTCNINNRQIQKFGGNHPDMPNKRNSENNQPPEKPNDNNTEDNSQDNSN